MSGTSSLVGGPDVGSNVNGSRKRVSGMLSRGPRGLILTTDSELWIIETDDDITGVVGRRVIVEGTVAGFDRLRADWSEPLNEDGAAVT